MELKQIIKITGGVLNTDEHAQCNFASFDNIAAAAAEKHGQMINYKFGAQKGTKLDTDSTEGASGNARIALKMETIRLGHNASSIVDLELDTCD